MQKYSISVAGNIGVGKSTLVGMIADEFGYQPYYEVVAEHPYLADYYADRQRWGFHSQVWFLAQRFEQQHEIADTPLAVVQDRSIYEDYEVFVKGLLEQGILSHRDFRTYRQLYRLLIQHVEPPRLVIYLEASVATLEGRIAKRARPAEQAIPRGYLEQLNQRYEDWLRRWELCPVLRIGTDDRDVVGNTADREFVLGEVRRALSRLPARLQLQLPGVDR
ncbi:MAG: deoxynucleoside kinase [Herpetosiphon sp.]